MHIVHTRPDKTGETTKCIVLHVRVNMRAHVRLFFQRANIYRSTMVHCGVHSEHECNPRAPPFKEVDTRNPISPDVVAIARDDCSGISLHRHNPQIIFAESLVPRHIYIYIYM